MAFSCQLLPITIDILFLRRGTPAGAAAGVVAGTVVVIAVVVFGDPKIDSSMSFFADLRRLVDIGFAGAVVNTGYLHW